MRRVEPESGPSHFKTWISVRWCANSDLLSQISRYLCRCLRGLSFLASRCILFAPALLDWVRSADGLMDPRMIGACHSREDWNLRLATCRHFLHPDSLPFLSIGSSAFKR